MEKSTIYLITIIIIAVAVVGVSGEYFAYKYYSLLAVQNQGQQQTVNPPVAQAQSQPASSEKKSANIRVFECF